MSPAFQTSRFARLPRLFPDSLIAGMTELSAINLQHAIAERRAANRFQSSLFSIANDPVLPSFSFIRNR